MNLSSRDRIPRTIPDPLKKMRRDVGGYVCVRTPDGKSLFGWQAAKCMDNLILHDFFFFLRVFATVCRVRSGSFGRWSQSGWNKSEQEVINRKDQSV